MVRLWKSFDNRSISRIQSSLSADSLHQKESVLTAVLDDYSRAIIGYWVGHEQVLRLGDVMPHGDKHFEAKQPGSNEREVAGTPITKSSHSI
jgi:hypothetical protein